MCKKVPSIQVLGAQVVKIKLATRGLRLLPNIMTVVNSKSRSKTLQDIKELNAS